MNVIIFCLNLISFCCSLKIIHIFSASNKEKCNVEYQKSHADEQLNLKISTKKKGTQQSKIEYEKTILKHMVLLIALQ